MELTTKLRIYKKAVGRFIFILHCGHSQQVTDVAVSKLLLLSQNEICVQVACGLNCHAPNSLARNHLRLHRHLPSGEIAAMGELIVDLNNLPGRDAVEKSRNEMKQCINYVRLTHFVSLEL